MGDFKQKFIEIYKEDEEEALSFLEKYIDINKEDLEAKISYILYVQSSPFNDFPSALKMLEDLTFRENGYKVRAVILKSFIEYLHMGEIKDNTFMDIRECLLNNKNDKYCKQLLISKALYYFEDTVRFIDCLNESISNDQTASYNHFLLGRRLKTINKAQEGNEHIKKAVDNIINIYDLEILNEYNPIDFQEFIDEFFRGVNITKPNFDEMVEELNSI